MKNNNQSQAELVDELTLLRQRVAELETIVTNSQADEQFHSISADRFFQVALSLTNYIYVFELKPDNRRQILYLSPDFETLTGYPKIRLTDWSFWSTQLIHPDDRAAQAIQTAQLALGQNSEVEYRLICADGQERWVRDSAALETIGETKIVYGVVTDITDRKHREESLARLVHLSRALVTVEDPTLMFDQAIKLAVDIAPAADRGSLQLLAEDRATMRTVATSTPDEPLENTIIFKPGVGIAGYTLAKNQIINVPDVTIDERFTPSPLPLRFRSLLVAPLVVKGRLLGTLSLSSEQIGAFSFADETLVQLIADQAAAALENARLATSQQQAEKFRKAHQFLQATIDALATQIAILDEQSQIVAVNANWRRHAQFNHYGHPNYGIGVNYLAVCDAAMGENAEEAPLVAEGIRQVMAGKRPQFYLEYPLHTPRQKQWYGVRVTRFEDEGAFWTVVAHEDVTERRLTEEALRASEEKYRSLTNQLPVGIYRATAAGQFTYANPAMVAMLGYESVLELIKASAQNLFQNPAERTRQLEEWRTHDSVIYQEMKLRTKNGDQIWVRDIGRAFFTDDGQIDYIDGIVQDITEQKEARESLLASESRFRSLVQNSSDIITILDTDGRVQYVSSPVERILGYHAADLIGQKVIDYIHPDDHGMAQAWFSQTINQPDNSNPIEFRVRQANNKWLWMEAVSNNLLSDPTIRGVVINVRDAHTRRQAEEQLQLLATAVGSTDEGILITDARQRPIDAQIVFVNHSLCRISGYQQAQLIGRSLHLFCGPKTDPLLLYQLDETLAQGLPFSTEIINYRQDGSEYQAAWHISPILDLTGQVTHYVSIQRDVTQFKALEAQFLQIQKMEAVGRLAGGIAHDFNNFLTVIKGYSELLGLGLNPQDPLRTEVENIRRTAEQAAALTRQLLVFSRKEEVKPQALNLSEVVVNLEKMVQRLIGQEIDLITTLEPDLGLVRADRGQIEQVIMNLVINARDAMPSGGYLAIETTEVTIIETTPVSSSIIQPGDYVQLSIIDTGMGMDEETLAHIFEPFYTTKEQDKGTGLGLSTVYAIVTQHNGHIQVLSRPGQGTTFKIYLPRLSDNSVQIAAPPEIISVISARGNETILVVENENWVRELVRELLSQQGYNVLEAQDGDEVINLCRQYKGPIHLLITNIILSRQWSGPELAQQVQSILPETKVIYMSSYTDEVVSRYGISQTGAVVLPKPFTPQTLLQKTREVLDSPASTVNAG
jgi:PAS domain S-box-containing protein